MRAFHKLLLVYVFRYFYFGFEGRMWDLILCSDILPFCFYNMFN